jgi:hypothetical protein
MMITAVAAIALAIVAHGWNEDQQMPPVGVPYLQVRDDDGSGTLEVASWYTLEDWEMVKVSAASFAIDEDGHVRVNVIDPVIGWGE